MPLPFLAWGIGSRNSSTKFRIVASDTEKTAFSGNTRHYILQFPAEETYLETIKEKDIMVKIKEDWQITDEAVESFSLNFHPSFKTLERSDARATKRKILAVRESSQITICSPYIITRINRKGPKSYQNETTRD